MSLKIHLMVVLLVSIVVFMFWKLSLSSNEQPVTPTITSNPDFGITVAYATWGENCAERLGMSPTQFDNNVHEAVSLLCNGKSECKITLSTAGFKIDPAPECQDKLLEVEYRCFSFDKLRSIQSNLGSLEIICDPKDATGTPN